MSASAEREGPLRLLVVGGSLGAQALNEAVPRALARLSAPVSVMHQAGEKHIERLRANYRAAGVEGELVAFIDDMARRYAEADLVICRAGAVTIAELSAGGVASILVPFPHAVDDHQTANARFLADKGAAILVPQTRDERGEARRTDRVARPPEAPRHGEEGALARQAGRSSSGGEALHGDLKVKHKVRRIHFVGIGGSA